MWCSFPTHCNVQAQFLKLAVWLEQYVLVLNSLVQSIIIKLSIISNNIKNHTKQSELPHNMFYKCV